VGDIRVLFVDDHQAFGAALAVVASNEPDLTCVGVVSSGHEARRAATERRPDVAVVDVNLAGESGIELASQLRAECPNLRVVMITAHRDARLASAAVRAGVSGYLTKDGPVNDLLEAIRGSVRGESFVTPCILTGVLRELQSPESGASAEARRLATLSQREAEVLDCMVAGMDRAAIARHLFLSVNTVRTHTRKVLSKLAVHSSLEAVALALRADGSNLHYPLLMES
jgi:DNA-binding NarL/FixJ family response regulator